MPAQTHIKGDATNPRPDQPEPGGRKPPPLRPRSIAGFFAKFLLYFALLMAPWPALPQALQQSYPGFFRTMLGRVLAVGPDLLAAASEGLLDGYAYLFRAGGNAVFGIFGSNGRVDLVRAESADRATDTDLQLENTRTKAAFGATISSRVIGYQPTAFMVALALATPLPWLRRLRAAALGVVGVQLFVGLRLWITILLAFNAIPTLALFPMSHFVEKTVGYAEWVLVRSFAGSYVVPLCLWFVVSFRSRDVRALLGPRAGAEEIADKHE